VFETVKAAGVIVALVIGAAFATGQEALQFFVAEGFRGIVAIAITFAIGIHMSITLFVSGYRHGFRNHEEFYVHYAGRIVGEGFSWYSTLVMFCIYLVMLSGAGTVLNEATGLPIPAGAAIMAAVALMTLYFGLDELVAIVGTLGPLLVLLILGIAGYTLFSGLDGLTAGHQYAVTTQMTSASDHWWLSGALYMSLQVVGLASFLPAVGATLKSEKQGIIAGCLGPSLLCLALVVVVLALLSYLPVLADKPIPMLVLAANISESLAGAYAYVIVAGIYTTCAPCLWISISRFARLEDGTRYKVLLFLFSGVGYGIAMLLPFGELVNLIYPTIGYAGLLLIGIVVFNQMRDRSIA